MIRFITCLILICLGYTVSAQKKNDLEVTRLMENFYIYTTYQEVNGVLFPANGMYVLTDEGAVLIDTPWDPNHYQSLLDHIYERHQYQVVLSLSTHWHEDRAGGFGHYQQQGIPTLASARTQAFLETNGKVRASTTFENDTTIRMGKIQFDVLSPGEGHTSDNVVVWFENEKILYGGCLVKSTEAKGMGYIKEANLVEWPRTIQSLQKDYPEVKHVIPGHQDWSDPRSLEYTLQLLEQNSNK